MAIRISSSAFVDGAAIPRQYTGDGQDISPPLEWSGVPAQAQALALICEDPDAPTPEPWVHWLIYGMPATATAVPEAIGSDATIVRPFTAMQGKNSWTSGRTIGYRGPAPPRGHGLHHYVFQVVALDQPLSLAPGADVHALRQAMQGHVLATGQLIGTYQR